MNGYHSPEEWARLKQTGSVEGPHYPGQIRYAERVNPETDHGPPGPVSPAWDPTAGHRQRERQAKEAAEARAQSEAFSLAHPTDDVLRRQGWDLSVAEAEQRLAVAREAAAKAKADRAELAERIAVTKQHVTETEAALDATTEALVTDASAKAMQRRAAVADDLATHVALLPILERRLRDLESKEFFEERAGKDAPEAVRRAVLVAEGAHAAEEARALLPLEARRRELAAEAARFTALADEADASIVAGFTGKRWSGDARPLLAHLAGK